MLPAIAVLGISRQGQHIIRSLANGTQDCPALGRKGLGELFLRGTRQAATCPDIWGAKEAESSARAVCNFEQRESRSSDRKGNALLPVRCTHRRLPGRKFRRHGFAPRSEGVMSFSMQLRLPTIGSGGDGWPDGPKIFSDRTTICIHIGSLIPNRCPVATLGTTSKPSSRSRTSAANIPKIFGTLG